MIEKIWTNLGLTEGISTDEHMRFYDSADNLFLVLLGLPLALAFQQVATAWLPDETQSDMFHRWCIPVIAVFVLFLLFAVAFGLGSFIVIYWKQYKYKSAALTYVFLGIFGTIILSSLVMGTLAEDQAMAIRAGETLAHSIAFDRSFLFVLAVFTTATIGAEVLVLSDILGYDITMQPANSDLQGQTILKVSFPQFLIMAVPLIVIVLELAAIGFKG